MRNTALSRITVFKRRQPSLFWLIVATIIVYILGAVYAPWEWGRISESDTFNKILYSGIGEMFWILHDISIYADEVYPDVAMGGAVGMYVFALFSWLIFIKNIVLGHFECRNESSGFGKAVRDYLFDIIFSYITALICYHVTGIFFGLLSYEGYSTTGYIIMGVVLFVLIFFPSVIAGARLGLIMWVLATFSDKFVGLVKNAHISVFPLNILGPLLSGTAIFLIGFIVDVLCTYAIRMVIRMSEHFCCKYEEGISYRVFEILYKMT